MSSQLPNIVGGSNHTSHSGATSGAFRPHITDPRHTGHGWGGNLLNRGLKMDASLCSTIYKNNVTQVFGDSMAYNTYIKAKIV